MALAVAADGTLALLDNVGKLLAQANELYLQAREEHVSMVERMEAERAHLQVRLAEFQTAANASHNGSQEQALHAGPYDNAMSRTADEVIARLQAARATRISQLSDEGLAYRRRADMARQQISMRSHSAEAAIRAFDILFGLSVGAKPKDEGDALDHWQAWQEARKACLLYTSPSPRD